MKNLPLFTSLALCGGVFAVFVSAFAQSPKPNLAAAVIKSPPLSKKIVIIGSLGSQAPNEKNISNTIPMFASWMKASPLFAGVDVLSYTNGWPADLSVVEGASSIVCYFDKSASDDLARIALIGKLMDSGSGLVCIGKSSIETFTELLGCTVGGASADVALQPVVHPVSAGVGRFTGNNAFPVNFTDEKNTTPILRSDGQVSAWVSNHPSGGRSFAFAGGVDLQSTELRKLIVNAIAWTSKIDIPENGVSTPEPIVATAVVNKMVDNKVVEMPWGRLRWFTSAELNNSRTMTTGVAIISPGKSNPRHLHPNCDEVLHVISGKISHTMNEVTVELNTGDTVSIPQGVLHNATNIGSIDAVLGISFSSAYREAVGY